LSLCPNNRILDLWPLFKTKQHNFRSRSMTLTLLETNSIARTLRPVSK
jgi:hypothetical protein